MHLITKNIRDFDRLSVVEKWNYSAVILCYIYSFRYSSSILIWHIILLHKAKSVQSPARCILDQTNALFGTFNHNPNIRTVPHAPGYLLKQQGKFWLREMQFDFQAGAALIEQLSWFHKRTAGLRRPAPCRRGRWRSASATGRCNPRGRSEGRAGTEWGRCTQSPSCRSHTPWLSCQRGRSPGQKCPWAGAEWDQSSERCEPAPPLSTYKPDNSHKGWGDTLELAESVPGQVEEALQADFPPRTRSTVTGHPPPAQTNSSPCVWDHRGRGSTGVRRWQST